MKKKSLQNKGNTAMVPLTPQSFLPLEHTSLLAKSSSEDTALTNYRAYFQDFQ